MDIPEGFVRVDYKTISKMKKIGSVTVVINGVVKEKPITERKMGVFAGDQKLHEITLRIYHWGKRV